MTSNPQDENQNLTPNIGTSFEAGLPFHEAVPTFAGGVKEERKKMIKLVIAIILGIMAITATAATARVALSQGVQIVHFVQQWHEDSRQLWTSQGHTDSELNTKIKDLEHAVLGDQIINLQHQLHLNVIGIPLHFV